MGNEPELRNRPGARVVLMPRVSTQLQKEEGTSLETQREALLAEAAKKQYKVVAVLEDTWTGADIDRPALSQARAMAKRNEIDVVLVYKVDRFFRNATHASVVEYELNQRGVAVETVKDATDNTWQGRFLRSQMAHMAEWEREQIKDRTSEGLRKRLTHGKLKTSHSALFGYVREQGTNGTRTTYDRYVLDDELAPIVRELFERTAAGEALSSITRSLNERSVPTPSVAALRRGDKGNGLLGETWTQDVIRRLLHHTAYKGEWMAYKRTAVKGVRYDPITGQESRINSSRARREGEVDQVHVSVPAIVSPELWEQVQRQLERNKEQSRRRLQAREGVEEPLLRVGHALCAGCGRPVYASFHTTRKVYIYKCQWERWQRQRSSTELVSCPSHSPSLYARELDPLVWQRVRDFLERPDFREAFLHVIREKHAQAIDDGGEYEQQLANVKTLRIRAERTAANAEKAYTYALGAEDFSPATMVRFQKMIDDALVEVQRLQEEEARVAAALMQVRATVGQVDQVATVLQEVSERMGRLEELPYDGKRRLLWLLGVRVYLGAKGENVDGDGQRWRLEFDFDGVMEIAATRGIVSYSSTIIRTSLARAIPWASG